MGGVIVAHTDLRCALGGDSVVLLHAAYTAPRQETVYLSSPSRHRVPSSGLDWLVCLPGYLGTTDLNRFF